MTLASVTWVFILSYSLAVANAVWDRLRPESQPPYWEAFVLSMMGLNVLANPLIYLTTNERFRRFVVNGVTGLFTGQHKKTITTALFSSAMLTTAPVVTGKEESRKWLSGNLPSFIRQQYRWGRYISRKRKKEEGEDSDEG